MRFVRFDEDAANLAGRAVVEHRLEDFRFGALNIELQHVDRFIQVVQELDEIDDLDLG